MITLESKAEMEADPTWYPGAEKGWALHQPQDGRVVAVNVAQRLATQQVKTLGALLKQLEKDLFSYKQFMAFKQLTMP